MTPSHLSLTMLTLRFPSTPITLHRPKHIHCRPLEGGACCLSHLIGGGSNPTDLAQGESVRHQPGSLGGKFAISIQFSVDLFFPYKLFQSKVNIGSLHIYYLRLLELVRKIVERKSREKNKKNKHIH